MDSSHHLPRQAGAWLPALLAFGLPACTAPETTGRRPGPGDDGEASLGSGQPVESRPPRVVIEDGLTLDEALLLALEQSPRLLAVRRTLGVATAQQLTASQWPYNPVFSSGVDPTFPLSAGQFDLRVGVSQQFELGGQRGRREAVAEVNLARAQAEVADAERVASVEVATAFVEALSLGERVSLVERNRAVARQLLDAAEARFAAKQVPELDVNLVRLELRRVENELAQAAATRDAALLRLRALLGLPVAPTVVGALSTAALPEVDRDQAVSRALERRPDLVERRRRVELTRRQVELEESRRWPDLELGLFYGRSIDDAGGLGLVDKDHAFGVDVSLPLPLFNTRRGEIAEARAQVEVAEADLEAAERFVVQDVDLALNRLALARQTLQLYQGDLTRLSRANLAGLETAYRGGEVGTLVVLRAQEDANRVSIGLLDALLEYHQARIALNGLLAEELSR